MDPIKSVIKSKSSNSALTSKSQGSKHKKSRSSAEFQFQPLALKKRGMYVEKKGTKSNIKVQDTQDLQPKRNLRAPPHQRRGQKIFLSSVISILSNSTAGTHQLDKSSTFTANIDDSAINVEKNNQKITKQREITTTHAQTQDVKNKPKYRSRILNDESNQDEGLVVLRKKRDVLMTPSKESQRSKEIESKCYNQLQLKNDEQEVEFSIADSLKRAVVEGKNYLRKGTTLSYIEPATLVSDTRQRDYKGLYSFFVDLLETTFSVYNVNAEYNAARPPSETESKIAFEIEESVAKKLDVTNKDVTPQSCCLRKDNNNKYVCYKDDEINLDIHDADVRIDMQTPRRFRPSKTTKLRTESLAYTKPPTLETSRTQSEIAPKRASRKKNRKQNLLNLLKEELRMDLNVEEPDNMHDALKIIARNKRRGRKSIKFAANMKEAEEDDHDCVFKRKVLSKTKNKRNKIKETNFLTTLRAKPQKMSDASFPSKTRSGYTTDESHHSLKVQGFDYETTPRQEMKNQKLMFAYPPVDVPLYERERQSVSSEIPICADACFGRIASYGSSKMSVSTNGVY